MRRGSFAFTKWYIDCLDREGRLVILYWASLEWRRLRLSWHSMISCAPGEKPRTRSSLVPCAPPSSTATGVHWRSARLDCEATLTQPGKPRSPGEPQQLAPGVTWTCVVPAAYGKIRMGDEVVSGTGYAEVVELTTPPWNVGIQELRWGRFISDDASQSKVWIDWKGDADRHWVFPNNGATLTLDEPVVVMDRGLNHVVGKVPGLRAVAPRWLLGGHEVRRTRTGTLGGTRGTAVDEIVEFG